MNDENLENIDNIDEENDVETQEGDQTADLTRQLAEMEEMSKTNLSGWQRSQADFENFKRRKENESQELVVFAREVTVAKILPSLDSLEQGLKHIPDTEDSEFKSKFDVWKKGIASTLQQLEKALSELGVKKIEAIGKQFDPNFHEAIREIPDETKDDGTVVEEMQTGYVLNGKVIRPSQVVISKKLN